MAAKNRVELKQYIRFQLAQMSARNDQHLFERAMFELARQRVSRAILPATGPVQAGGDQGRDAETYRNYIGENFGARAWLGRGEDEALVFACTLDKQLPAKVKADLESIFGSGERPDAVYYYAEPDLPVARRHELQAHCADTYQARLELFDGQAIADQLADPDTFWIAEHFFSVPSEMYPAVETDEEYEALRETWLSGKRTVVTPADFIEFKRGLREAVASEIHILDLDRWLSAMSAEADRRDGPFWRRAVYEIMMARMRANRGLEPERERLEAYFADLPETPGVAELEDAAVAALVCKTSCGLGALPLPNEVVDGWVERVRRAVTAAFAREPTSGERYVLLLSRAQLRIAEAPGDLQQLDGIFADWREALALAETNPFCDVAHFARVLEMLVPLGGRRPDFAEIADTFDRITAAREGAAAAAERSRGRAMAHFDADQPLQAIDQLQRTKEGWFAAETMRGSILAMMLLSQTYRELHLPLAARLYAVSAQLAARQVEDETLRRYTARAGFEVANSFFAAGEWASYLAAVGQALALHGALETEAEDLSRHEHVQIALAQAAKVRAIVATLWPEGSALVDQILDAWPVDPDLIAFLREISEGEAWRGRDPGDLERQLALEVGQSFAEDFRDPVDIRWRALGIGWSVSARREDRLLAEQLAATLQVVQVELADLELLVVPSNVALRVGTTSAAEPEMEQEPDNGELRWAVRVPRRFERDSAEDVRLTLTVVMTALGQSTALSLQAFQQIVEARIERGLLNRAFWLRPPGDLLAMARREAALPDGASTPPLPTFARPEPPEAEPLAWRDGPGPGYSREKADEFLGNRYRRMMPFAKQWGPRLMQDPKIAAILRRMHADGMPDWQIIAVLFNIALQHHVEAEAGAPVSAAAQMRSQVNDLLDRLEAGEALDVDPSVFTAERIEGQRKVQIGAAANTWELVLNRQTPDFEALKRLLDERFAHSADDIPHDDVFRWSEAEPFVVRPR